MKFYFVLPLLYALLCPAQFLPAQDAEPAAYTEERRLEWTPVKNAEYYKLELEKENGDGSWALNIQLSLKDNFCIVSPGIGLFRYRVTAYDALGFSSKPSGWAQFRILPPPPEEVEVAEEPVKPIPIVVPNEISIAVPNEITVKSSGLSTKQRESSSPDFSISLNYLPSFPFSEVWTQPATPFGVGFSLSLVPIKFNSFNFGFELSASYFDYYAFFSEPVSYGDLIIICSKNIIGVFNLMLQFPIVESSFFFKIKGGLGYSYMFDANNWRSDTTDKPTVNSQGYLVLDFGASMIYYPAKNANFFMEMGFLYTRHWTPYFPNDAIAVDLGLGWTFSKKRG